MEYWERAQISGRKRMSKEAWNGRPAPGVASAAKQAGAYVAEALCARIYGDPSAAVPLSALGQSGDDRTQESSGRSRPNYTVGGGCVVVLGNCPSLAGRWTPQSRIGIIGLDLVLRDLSGRRSTHHRRPRHRGRCSAVGEVTANADVKDQVITGAAPRCSEARENFPGVLHVSSQ
jgi:NADH dehydrogenase FAD-containing subunit